MALLYNFDAKIKNHNTTQKRIEREKYITKYYQKGKQIMPS